MLQKRIMTLCFFAFVTFVMSMNIFTIQANTKEFHKEFTSSSAVTDEELIAFQQTFYLGITSN